jgi:hypothetical protein
MARFAQRFVLVSTVWLLALSSAHAEQTRDFMIAAPENGTDVMVDLIFPGVQTTLEHRVPIYGIANQLTLRGNALYTLPFYESQADAELRILILTLGASGGFRSDFRSLSFREDERLDRHHRRLREIDGKFASETWGFGEGRATLSLPINDYVVFNAINSLRFQGSPDRNFDWRTGVVHDGEFFRSDIMLFLKHRAWGGFAPLMQILNFSADGDRFTQFNYGFMLVTRPGFRLRDDIFLLQLLFHPGPTFGGYDNEDSYGMHLFFAPITFTIAYRMMLPVWRPE